MPQLPAQLPRLPTPPTVQPRDLQDAESSQLKRAPVALETPGHEAIAASPANTDAGDKKPADESATPTDKSVPTDPESADEAASDGGEPSESPEEGSGPLTFSRSLPKPGKIHAPRPASNDFSEAQTRAVQERAPARRGMDTPPPKVHHVVQDTQQLLLSAVEDLVEVSKERARAAGDLDDEFNFRTRVPKWFWVVGAAAVLLLMVWSFGGSDGEPDLEPVQTPVSASPPPVSDESPASPTPRSAGSMAAAATDGAALYEAGADPSPAQEPGELAPADGTESPPEGASPGDPAPADTPAPTNTRRKRRKASSRASAKAETAVADDTPPSPKEKKKPADKPPTAGELLASAKKALKAGKAKRAYSKAKKSYKLEGNVAALLVMGRAACVLKDAKKAKSAVRKLSFKQGRQVRRECRDNGVRLGL